MRKERQIVWERERESRGTRKGESEFRVVLERERDNESGRRERMRI